MDAPRILDVSAGRSEWIDRLLQSGSVVLVIAPPGTMEQFPLAEPAPVRPVLQAGLLTIDVGERLVLCSGEQIHTSGREFELLSMLARPPGQLRTYRELYEHAWQERYLDATAVRSAVKRLRRRLVGCPDVSIISVRGVGCRLVIRD